jgi:hypothetical protein
VIIKHMSYEKDNLRRTGCSSLSTTLYSRDPLLSTHKNLLAVCTQFKGWLHYAWQKECAVHDTLYAGQCVVRTGSDNDEGSTHTQTEIGVCIT